MIMGQVRVMGQMRVNKRKEQDFAELGELAIQIKELKKAYQRRRVIWKRRLDSGDSTQAELARASDVALMQIRLGIQDKYFKKD